MSLTGTSARRHVEILKDLAFCTAGSALMALSIRMFTAPNHIAPGGISGISTVVNYLSGWPIGMLTLLFNVPIFFFAFLEIGYKLVFKSAVATLLLAFAIDLIGLVVRPYTGSPMLAAIFGGCLDGAGLSLIFMRGATTGGTDLIARLLGRRLRFLSIGRLMRAVDFVIVAFSAVVYRSIDNALYAFIAIFVSTQLVDAALYGTDIGTGKMLLIISEESGQIAKEIIASVDRGVTLLEGRGAYSGKTSQVILSAVRRYEVAQVKDIVHAIDPHAFIIVGDAGEISGEGFRSMQPNDKTLKQLLHAGRKKN